MEKKFTIRNQGNVKFGIAYKDGDNYQVDKNTFSESTYHFHIQNQSNLKIFDELIINNTPSYVIENKIYNGHWYFIFSQSDIIFDKPIGYKSTIECYHHPVGTLFILGCGDYEGLGGWYYPKEGDSGQYIPKLLVEKYFTPVYEYEIKLPKINGYEGEILNNNVVKYGCQSFTFDEVHQKAKLIIDSGLVEGKINFANHPVDIKQIIEVCNLVNSTNYELGEIVVDEFPF